MQPKILQNAGNPAHNPTQTLTITEYPIWRIKNSDSHS